VLAGVLVTAFSFLGSGLAREAAHLDHCLGHHDGHPHLCLSHGDWLPNLLGWCLLAASALTLAWALHRASTRRLRGRANLDALSLLGATERPGYTLLDLEQPLAFTAGLWAPRVWVSKGMLDRIGGVGLRAVLAHEAAHARHRDPLRQLLLETAALVLPVPVRKELLTDLGLALERRADEAAAGAIGSRLRVAETLLQAQRMLALRPLAASFFQGSRLEARVTALLDPPVVAPARRLWPWAIGAVATAALLADPLHHGVETLLGFLSR
jgi:hypothetical protein